MKSLDEYKIIAAALCDIQRSHGVVFNSKALKFTRQKVNKRTMAEGLSFLTKTLPRLGKAFDKALCGIQKLNCSQLGLKTQAGSELPLFLGELFSQVFYPDGSVLPNPCAKCVKSIRQITYLFYKYELPYDTKQEQEVISRFKKTEEDISTYSCTLRSFDLSTQNNHPPRRHRYKASYTPGEVIIRARQLLERVFSGLDLTNIVPKHGPGTVSGKEQPWEKYNWTTLPERLTKVFPADAFFFASAGHLCDEYRTLENVRDTEPSARVLLVPKDSRGPRLISCEPKEFQWIQQGIMARLVSHVESIKLTKFNVFFTNQLPNRYGALLGSKTGKYATLDLNEASDRVSVDLVRLLFPPSIVPILECCRSLSTELPDGTIMPLQKFAPMGSALCFPILALTVWSILTASAPDADTCERILVYGDDVIVPTANAANAIEWLEAFGLKVNRDKSCTSGFFRESCGQDAFQGVDVTPVRLRTVWSSTPSPNVYSSYIAYANAFYDMGWYETYDVIVGGLLGVYPYIPDDELGLTSVPSLRYNPEPSRRYRKKRYNQSLQKVEYFVPTIKSVSTRRTTNGWTMLFRFLIEKSTERSDGILVSFLIEGLEARMNINPTFGSTPGENEAGLNPAFSVGLYTKRGASMLALRWR